MRSQSCAKYMYHLWRSTEKHSQQGISELVNFSEWATPVVLIIQKDRSGRLYGHYKGHSKPSHRDCNLIFDMDQGHAGIGGWRDHYLRVASISL